MKKAFSLIELLLVITLMGVMAFLTSSYFNITTISKQNIKTEFESHINIITANILQCKELSGYMPTQVGGALASGSALNSLECKTTPTYALNGGRGAFVPPPLSGFTLYKASQSGGEFYFSTTTALVSSNYEVLDEIKNNYSSNQFELTNDGTTATLKFYLSR